MSTDIFLCNICKTDRSFNKFPEYFRHITLYHANEPNFKLTCNLSDSCGVMYKTFTAYKTHIHRYHKSLLNSSFEQRGNNDTDDINQLSFLQPDTTADCSTIYDNNEDNIIYTDLMDDNPDDKWNIFKTNNSFDDGKINLNTVHQQYTRFLLEMREEHILPQTVIQSITTHIVNLFDIIIELVEEQAKQENLAEQQPTAASISIDGLRKTIKKIEQAITLSTRNEYQFLQSCKKFFDYSPPVENILSSNQSKNEQSCYIPIKHSLKKILQKDEMIPLLVENIRSQATLNHSDRDLMFSFRDGIKGEKINKQSFLIQLYVDGIGVTNPLGSKKDQHKLTLVYFALEDIPDIFRSTLQCINLASICYTKYLNNNEKLKKFYEPIVQDLNDLQNTGLVINTFNSQILFTFTTIAADNLAAHEVAGFQLNFNAGHFCRRCMVSYENRLIPLTDIHFIHRNHLQHQRYLQLIENNAGINSIFGGIGRSPLNDLQNFDPTASCPGDVMHDFFEGVCPLIVMAMLKEASHLRLMTYAAIQKRTESFDYGELDTPNKPPPVQIKHMNNDRITGTATQKYCLFLLRELLDMILALPQRKSWLPFMETLATNFQCMMLDLLPGKAIPKVHYVTEYEDEQHEDENDTTESSVNSSVISTKITTQDTPKELSFPDEYLLPVLPNQNSWRESLISKYKRERQNSNDERRVEMKLKYSRETSGRKIKQRPITEMSERNVVNKILLAENISSNNEQMAAKSETIKEDFQNSSFDYENLKQLWLETYEYRQSFINQNSIADVMEQFPAYSNPLMVLTDVKILKGIDVDISVKEKLDLLAGKICSGNQYITDSSSIRCFKVLCGILNDSWKHYIYFHPEKPATPQPSIVIEDDGIKVYLDWTCVCSSSSIEQSLGIIVSLYCIMNLKFHPHRTAIRFLYVYFLNEKQHQSNCIRKFCKEYNIELEDKSSSTPIDRLEEIENVDPPLNKETEQDDENLFIDKKQDSPTEMINVAQIIQAEPMSIDPQINQKRKSDQLVDEQASDNENAPPTKKTARPTKKPTQPTRPTRSTRSTSRKS
ncbi:unnamed protein product [Adineta steineri]|uniref:C2H2-type domain-containing protein n=1 Tax=Adineta steineri TaxID=433720 RepID=A0A819VHN7_9BILA|nr:unnamed protein product [Adineta steineri]